MVDDIAETRELARAVIEQTDGFRVVGAAEDGIVGMELARKTRPDLIVIDLSIPDGVTVLAALRNELPGAGVVGYARFPERETLALAAGVDAFVPKDRATELLAEALRSVSEVAGRESRPAVVDFPWSRVLDAVADGVIVRNAQGSIVFANVAADALLGLHVRDLGDPVGEDPVMELCRADGSPLPPEELPGLVALTTGQPVRDYVIGCRSARRGLRWVSASAVPIRVEEGAPLDGVVTAFVDITDRLATEQALRESEARFRTSVETMLDGFAVYTARRNEEGRIVDLICEYVNPASADNRGIPAEEQLGRGMLELWPELEAQGLFALYAHVVDTGEPLMLDLPWYESARVRGSFEIRGAKLGDGCAVSFRDLTDRRRAEAELARSNEALAQFAAVTAHDLAEPLRGLAGFAELLQQRYADHLDVQAHEWIDFIRGGAARMKTLIDDLLVYSRAGSGPPDMGTVDLGTVAIAARDAVHATTREASATIEIGELPTVRGDATQLLQVLQNLFVNGVKFGRPGVAARIVVSAERDHDEWVISITDNGIGVPEAERDRVFVPFHRLTPGGDVAGSGLGLAICRRIVARHGGRISVESAPGGGSRFVFTLPAAPEP